jgi:hypothetical protein
MKKTARNAPCPCGSHKNFKSCCWPQAIPIVPLENDLEWQNLRKIEGKLWEGAFAFVSEKWGREILVDGWDAFCLDLELERNSSDSENLFPGWFIFRWIPYDYSEKWEHLGPHVTLADLYVQKNGLKAFKLFLTAVDQSPFSFFLVEDVIPSRRLVLKDLLLNRTVTIKEKKGADQKFKGTIVFARLISYEGQSIQIGFGTISLPLRYAMEVLDLKKNILEQEKNLTSAVLLKYDHDLRKAYFVWSEFANQPPKICNNDGDPIVLCTLYYKLSCSPKRAFDELAPLCKGENPKALLVDEKFDEKGELYSIQFPWLKNRKTDLILGDIKIERSQLMIHVNSVERSKKIQQEIKKRLREAIFENEDREFLDLENVEKKIPISSPLTKEGEKMMQAYLKNYYRQWLDSPLPTLNGRTPREAAKTLEGQERLHFLLLDFEISNHSQSPYLRIDTQTLRQELGLISANEDSEKARGN